jgi:hypothetical protein
VLSDRRFCLALDQPQLCNGHMGVRLGKRTMKQWGMCYLLKGEIKGCRADGHGGEGASLMY